MNARVLWQIIGTILVLGILAAGWFLIVQPVLASVAADELELEAVEAQNDLIVADIEAMTEIDLPALQDEVRDLTTQLPYAFDEAAIYRELEQIIERAGGELVRVAVTPPVEFVGVPSTAVLPEGLAPANTPEALEAAAEAGLVVATAAIEFDAPTHAAALEVISGLSQSQRVILVSSGTVAASATQRVLAELYFLPRDAGDVELLGGR